MTFCCIKCRVFISIFLLIKDGSILTKGCDFVLNISKDVILSSEDTRQIVPAISFARGLTIFGAEISDAQFDSIIEKLSNEPDKLTSQESFFIYWSLCDYLLRLHQKKSSEKEDVPAGSHNTMKHISKLILSFQLPIS
jgi:hypothetical protein